MGWAKERLAAFGWARGHRAWLYSTAVLFFGAAVAEIWPQALKLLSDWIDVAPPEKGGGMTILGHPAWSLLVIVGLLCFSGWLFESMFKLHKELSPNLNVFFDVDRGGLSETMLTNSQTGEYIDDCKYVRVAVENISRKTVAECVANLTKIEKRLDLARTEVIWDQDALPLQWAMVGGYEIKAHHLTKRFVDIAMVRKKSPQKVKWITVVPNILREAIEKMGLLC